MLLKKKLIGWKILLTIDYMHRALNLAKKGQYTARPNPCVGAVIVQQGEIVGEGYHAYYGGDHAEVMALKQAGEKARGATVYVTLEPCSHHGKTPPCVNALIEAGVAKVVVACLDPNPLVNGRGVQILREAGIEVEMGLLALNAQRLNAAFMHRMQTGRPRVILKSAMSLDGRTAMESGESMWITGPRARAHVQHLRAQSDAIVTGRGTIEQDDPSLTVRDETIIHQQHFKQPKRVVLDSQARLREPKIKDLAGETWHVTTQGKSHWKNQVQLPSEKGQVSLPELLKWLHTQQCQQVMVEAGAQLTGAFLKSGLVDEWHVFIAPKIMGSRARPLCELPLDHMAESLGLNLISSNMVGEDLYCIYSMGL